ncbi:MAG: CDP-glucose 4,6-dehydratase [Bacteroidales bacterium]|nr:CDP-glucose 4,6-dehydratase [Bacteroidales bacterium]
MFNDFYKNKKILITGHTGFKGSWLSIWLDHLGADVIGIALDPKNERDLFLLAGLSGKMTDYREDIRNLNKINEIFQLGKPEIVFHLAAQALVLPSYENPVTTFKTNIIGTANILEACRIAESVQQIVVITTDKVYENKEQITGYRENDPLGGHDPYSASKAGAEIITQSYLRSFFSPGFVSGSGKSVATARAGNVIGGGDWSLNRIIPDCIRSLEESKPVIVRNPDAIRPWQHVLEPLFGYLLLAYRMAEDPQKYSGAWNFGPEETDMKNVKGLVETMIKSWGSGNWELDTEVNKPHEAGILRLDINKSKSILGWKPVLNIDKALEMTVNWYKNYSSCDVYKLCIEQIKEYSKKWNSKS